MIRLPAVFALLLLALASGLLLSCAEDSPTSGGGESAGSVDGARLILEEKSHEFGKVKASEQTQRRFALRNGGDAPLQLGKLRIQPANPGG